MAKYRGKHFYLGAWGYVLLSILYMVPVVGLIFLLMHSFSKEDQYENRKHYARSYFARLLVVVVICVIAAAAYYFINGQEAAKELVTQIVEFVRHYVPAIPAV